ncbi:DEAD/DEAH helicase [Plasmodium gonderi]|uniref:DEAD/DEAH helicase n=1 Tax=Plasmodium gonderi TaxID=77519 RepID=A0A1Y1JB22_PLAGO|nr:DEAD/DEAH helicase [Plasmodium gonderi]GAW79450.1 DEAD/DEAH helicase [Plasmodium gonderi]
MDNLGISNKCCSTLTNSAADNVDDVSSIHKNSAQVEKNTICEVEKKGSFCENSKGGEIQCTFEKNKISNGGPRKEDTTGEEKKSELITNREEKQTNGLSTSRDDNTFELTSPHSLHRIDSARAAKHHEISDEKEAYLYISEHLRIKKNNEIFISAPLNDYINEHLNFFISCDEDFFRNKDNKAERFMEIGLRLKYLRYKDRMKRKKRMNRMNRVKKNKNSNKSGAKGGQVCEKSTITVEDDKCEKLMKKIKTPLEKIDQDSQTLSSSSSSSSSSSLSSHSSDSSSLFSYSSEEEGNLTDSPYTSDEEILKELKFDKEELGLMKKLEKAKNVYFGYVSNMYVQYNIFKCFNMKYFELVKKTAQKISTSMKNYKRLYDESTNAMQLFLENEENVKRIELCQKRLRSDVVNSMFGFHIINDTHPMKVPIKCINRLGAETKLISDMNSSTSLASNTFTCKSLQSRKRVETIPYWTVQKSINSSNIYDHNRKISPSEDQGDNKTRKRKGIIGKSNPAKVQDCKETIDVGCKNYLEEFIKNVKENSKFHNKMSSIKQYILMSNWSELKKHCINIHMLSEKRKRNASVIANLCYEEMKLIEEKKKIILEREEKERMRLLKENDMDAYIKLLKNTKNKRLQELLDVTEEFLNNMSSSLLCQKKETASEMMVPNGEAVDTHQMGSTSHYEKEKNILKSNYKHARDRYIYLSHSVKEKITQPSILVGGTLMKYQLEGLEWLISLYNNNLHGILADEMGLGKTIQTISLFAYLKEFKWGTSGVSGMNEMTEMSGMSRMSRMSRMNEVHRVPIRMTEPRERNGHNIRWNMSQPKNLVIVPLSTLPNWISEFKTWCPSLKVITYRGNKCERKGLSKQLVESEFDICLTTFDFVIKEKTLLMKIFWMYIVIDEGHRMKNSKSKLHNILAEFKSKHRILLTGTPLQNNLSELWSLLNFLLPKIFSSCIDFEKWFIRPLNNDKDMQEVEITEEEELLIINRLHSVLLPFMLRRVKKDVLKSLPKKYEYNIHIDLSLYQKMLYKKIEFKGFKMVNQNGSITSMYTQNIVMQLRKVVNHPYLFLPEYDIDDYIIKSSGKFEVLDRMLPKLLKFRHKILIFSQMTKLMDIMCDYLDYRGHLYHRLDGSIGLHERKKIIDEFNSVKNELSCDVTSQGMEPINFQKNNKNNIQMIPSNEPNGGSSETMIFILSTRSGSLGLNLQTADTVIIFDSDFNPHQDIQAMCRCHRIGQKNVVKVFRFITLSGVEELIFKKAKYKLSINDKVIQAGLFNKIYNDEDRKNKLKNIFQRNQKSQISNHSTNPLLLNYYMHRSEDELNYFMNFDKNYFGQAYYSHLQSLNKATTDAEQFTYMSEDDEVENGEEVNEEEVNGEEVNGEEVNGEEVNEEEVNGEEVNEEEVNGEEVNGEEVKGGGDTWEDERSSILKEENQNEIEKILIRSNKLINMDELPSYLFFDEEKEATEVPFKRTRKKINVHLMDEENLPNWEFMQLIGEVENGEMVRGEMATCEVATGEMATGEVETGEVATGEMATCEMATGEMATGEMATGEVETGEVATGEMATGEVETGEVATGEMATCEMATGEMATGEMATGEVETGEVANGEMATCEVVSGATPNDDVIDGDVLGEGVPNGRDTLAAEHVGEWTGENNNTYMRKSLDEMQQKCNIRNALGDEDRCVSPPQRGKRKSNNSVELRSHEDEEKGEKKKEHRCKKKKKKEKH